jgi:dipeptide/tripeptide permease
LRSALARRGSEPGEFTRLQIGVLCAAATYLLMAVAAVVQERQQAAVSVLWLLCCFVGLALGELLVYPPSLALVTCWSRRTERPQPLRCGWLRSP